MKKYLPLIIFIAVFALVLAGQIGYKKILGDSGLELKNPVYTSYENIFLHSKYKLLNGEELVISKIKAPVVIYNFWASWCIPCLEEMPSMIALKNKFSPDQVEIVAINTDEDDQRINIEKTMKKIKLTNEFLIVPDTASQIVEQFKISAIPVTIIFHRGKVVHFSNGPMDFNSVEIVESVKKWVSL
jgi:thiol-disulfide isomerase/thioredoxin